MLKNILTNFISLHKRKEISVDAEEVQKDISALREGKVKLESTFKNLDDQEKIKETLPTLLDYSHNCLYFKIGAQSPEAYFNEKKLRLEEIGIFANKLNTIKIKNLEITYFYGWCENE